MMDYEKMWGELRGYINNKIDDWGCEHSKAKKRPGKDESICFAVRMNLRFILLEMQAIERRSDEK